MFNIAIVDDEKRIRSILEQLVEQFAKEHQIELNVNVFQCGKDLISNLERYDAIFLDIEMPELNGIQLAETIRKTDYNVPIVYITSYCDYWRRAYKVHAFDFITKPFEAKDIYGVLSDLFLTLSDADDKTIGLHTENGVEIQKISEIMYCMVEKKRNILVSTVYKKYIVKENLVSIFEKLGDDRFYMTHRSCIVNMNYVESLQKNNGILLTDGEWVPLAQKKQKDFFEKLSMQLRRLEEKL